MAKKRYLALALAATMTVGLFAGCGSSDSGSSGGSGETAKESSESGDSGEKSKLTFWFPTFAASDGEVTDEEFWNEKMDKFEEENNCEVKVEIIPWDNYEEKYLTGSTSNDGPDVGYMYMEMFYDYIDNGTLADVDGYFTDEEKENYVYYDLGNLMGGQYALPVVVGNPRILIANMDVLNEAGITEVPTTIDEFTAACEAIKEKTDVTPFMQPWGNAHYGCLNECYWPFFWGSGAQIVDEEGNLTIDTPEGLEATEFIRSLLDNGYLPESCTSNDDTLESFKNGDAAMVVCASSNALQIKEINWDYSPVLQGSKDAKTFVAADSLVMFNKCENKELAAKLMKYVTSKEVMSDFHTRVSEQPPITKDDEYTGDERYATLFADYGDNFVSLPVFKGAASMYDTLFKNLQSMMLGEMEPQDVLTETTTYYNDNLK
ncbi:sugar ABC transporter substrate-binding protein [bacterium]|nr:sugar ABC transporter substrate-binding protein [bacterium]MDY3021443.1 sugar ABC transporter substrate-binding protein [Oliverpabstia sp.]